MCSRRHCGWNRADRRLLRFLEEFLDAVFEVLGDMPDPADAWPVEIGGGRELGVVRHFHRLVNGL
jgi:hypothetical protein